MELALITKYRTQLMGIAIIWIMFFHSHISVENTNNLIKFIQRIGYGGVDIFMFLSGFGVYFSISKEKSINRFYKRRALRIFPYYYPIVLIASIIACSYGIWPISSLFHNLFLTSFWIGLPLDKMFDWYVPALVFLYLITPLFYYFFKRNKIVTTIVTVILFYILTYYSFTLKYGYLISLTLRAPLYFLGFWVADFFTDNKSYKFNKISVFLLFAALISGLGCLYYLYFYTEIFESYGMFLWPFNVIIFPLCLFLSFVFSLFANFRFPILTFFGTYTLSLYIFHERILHSLRLLQVPGYPFIAIALAIIAAYAWQNFIDKMVSRC